MQFECKTCDLIFESAHAMRTHFRSYAHRDKADMNVVDRMLERLSLIEKSKDEPDKV